MRTILLCLCLLLAPAGSMVPLRAQDAPSPRPLFDSRDALFAGGFVLGTVALAPLDVRIAGILQDSVSQARPVLRASAGGFRLLGAPGTVLLTGGLYVAGHLADRSRLAEIGLHASEALIVGQVVNTALKLLVGRARPWMDVDDPFDFGLGRGLIGDHYQSFPSGHTAAAFATAAALSAELAEDYPDTRFLTGSLLYTGAALVGISRMYHNQHWASDVVMGAAIGSFAGWKVVQYAHDRPDNRVDRWLLSVSLPADLNGAARITLLPAW